MNDKFSPQPVQKQKKEVKPSIQKRIGALINSVSAGMYEREEIIAVALLGVLCGQNTFLYGPPGTAKSLISRRIACAFDQPAYFEYLMNRFSTPEEVFGPVSIKALKEDRYIRKTDCYLPKAEFAFLDEIWKSSPAILNTLLTLINEHIFRNGESIEKAPLKALIAASNETPEPNQGLDALFDRFIVRLMVGPISEVENFERLLDSKPTEAAITVPSDLIVKQSEWNEWRVAIGNVALSKETLTIIHLIRAALAERYEELKVYVSDRRWQRAAMLMKGAAFFNGRNQTNHNDALLLSHCLWTHADNREAVINIVEQAILDAGLDTGISLAELDRKKDQLDKEINEELYHTEDQYNYNTVSIKGKDYFQVEWGDGVNQANRFYISLEQYKSRQEFNPIDKNGNVLAQYQSVFDGQGSCHIYFNRRNFLQFKPKVKLAKGSQKENVNRRLISSLEKDVKEIRKSFVLILEQVEAQRSGFESQLYSVFSPSEKTDIAIQSINQQIDALNLRILDCDRLEALCR
ncbi:AAA domain-containing protein [Iodobacter sp. HSC-16F04]|uniref:AAA domain-containing protein n=1 Tax=Iodobacter violaceini TaxID=3044271 RepID=A0ABX0KMI9_9NEIS|nr:AAA family ATPase [Iodobacter violacea]NHQ84857.1 AAA domain-containing protein [Iodobacter violacea]